MKLEESGNFASGQLVLFRQFTQPLSLSFLVKARQGPPGDQKRFEVSSPHT